MIYTECPQSSNRSSGREFWETPKQRFYHFELLYSYCLREKIFWGKKGQKKTSANKFDTALHPKWRPREKFYIHSFNVNFLLIQIYLCLRKCSIKNLYFDFLWQKNFILSHLTLLQNSEQGIRFVLLITIRERRKTPRRFPPSIFWDYGRKQGRMRME